MFHQAPGYLAAFTAGILSFLTPCVLPLVPGYISFVSGISLSELQTAEAEKDWRKLAPVMSSTFAFILGFSLVFILTGALVYFIGEALAEHKIWLVRAAGVIIIIFGLHMAGALRIQALYREKRLEARTAGGGMPRAFILGFAFAFGWTPCAGPILGAIMGLASTRDQIAQAVALMCLYSAGMAVPFFITGLAVDRFFSFFERIKNHFRKIEIAAGALLVLIGALMLLDQFGLIEKIFELIVPEKFDSWG